MSAYVDDAAILYRGKLRYHLTADTVAELHGFAAAIGVRECWFHRGSRHPHYDVTGPQRVAAVDAGAHAVDPRTVLRVAKAARLREMESLESGAEMRDGERGRVNVVDEC